MRRILLTCLLWAGALVILPNSALAVDTASALTDREIIERLTRIETRLDGVDEGLSALRADIDKQNQQLNNRLGDFLWLFIGVMGFIGVIIAALIGVIIRERKTLSPLPPDAGESLTGCATRPGPTR